MFTGDTKNKQRSADPANAAWQSTNRNAGAQQHSTAEGIAAQDAAQSQRRRPLLTPVGGGGGNGFVDFWDSTVAYQAGSIVQIRTTTTYGGITILPGTYALRQGLSTPIGPTGNQIPQFPYPLSGTINWIFISPMPNIVSTCAGGSSASIYVASTASF